VADVQFFQTAMGRTFFEYTMPELVRELKKLNANLEKVSTQMEESRVDYAKVAQAIMDSPVTFTAPIEIGVPLKEKPDGPVE